MESSKRQSHTGHGNQQNGQRTATDRELIRCRRAGLVGVDQLVLRLELLRQLASLRIRRRHSPGRVLSGKEERRRDWVSASRTRGRGDETPRTSPGVRSTRQRAGKVTSRARPKEGFPYIQLSVFVSHAALARLRTRRARESSPLLPAPLLPATRPPALLPLHSRVRDPQTHLQACCDLRGSLPLSSRSLVGVVAATTAS